MVQNYQRPESHYYNIRPLVSSHENQKKVVKFLFENRESITEEHPELLAFIKFMHQAHWTGSYWIYGTLFVLQVVSLIGCIVYYDDFYAQNY